jgi:hypothetical protein
MGYVIRGIVDAEKVREMARINGDLGRLGGLLKLWLTNDIKTANFDPATIRRLLYRIETAQQDLVSTMSKVIRKESNDR